MGGPLRPPPLPLPLPPPRKLVCLREETAWEFLRLEGVMGCYGVGVRSIGCDGGGNGVWCGVMEWVWGELVVMGWVMGCYGV